MPFASNLLKEYNSLLKTTYDIIENELNINTDNMHLQAVHRVGKARSAFSDDAKANPRPVIVPFLLREDKDKVRFAKNKLKKSKHYEDIYITQDYARAIQMERKTLIKAMFKAKEKGLNAKVVDRNLMVNNAVFHVGNIPPEFKSPWSSCIYWIYTTSSVLLEKIANRNACLSPRHQLLSLFIIPYGRVLPNPGWILRSWLCVFSCSVYVRILF